MGACRQDPKSRTLSRAHGSAFERAAPSTGAHLGVQHVQPAVGDPSHGVIAALEGVAAQELVENLSLEDLDELQLPTTLQLKALKS